LIPIITLSYSAVQEWHDVEAFRKRTNRGEVMTDWYGPGL